MPTIAKASEGAIASPPAVTAKPSTLAEHEAVIRAQLEAGRLCAAIIGATLTAIKKDNLVPDFLTYCREVWGFEKSRVGQMLTYSEVLADLQAQLPASSDSTIVESEPLPLPDLESHARSLTHIPKGNRGQVWRRAIEELPEGTRMTARHVDRVVETWLYENQPSPKTASPKAIDRTVEKVGAEEELPDRISPQSDLICGDVCEADGKFDFAMVELDAVKPPLAKTLDRLALILRPGKRLVIFCRPMMDYGVVRIAERNGWRLEHSVISVEDCVVDRPDRLFWHNHQIALVFSNLKDQDICDEARADYPSTFLATAIDVMLEVYTVPSDRVLCIAESPNFTDAMVDRPLAVGMAVTELEAA
jgi:hypothetical protein